MRLTLGYMMEESNIISSLRRMLEWNTGLHMMELVDVFNSSAIVEMCDRVRGKILCDEMVVTLLEIRNSELWLIKATLKEGMVGKIAGKNFAPRGSRRLPFTWKARRLWNPKRCKEKSKCWILRRGDYRLRSGDNTSHNLREKEKKKNRQVSNNVKKKKHLFF